MLTSVRRKINMRIIKYEMKGWALEFTLNPFKLGTITQPRVDLSNDRTVLLPYTVRLYMIPFITIMKWNYKGEVNA